MQEKITYVSKKNNTETWWKKYVAPQSETIS